MPQIDHFRIRKMRKGPEEYRRKLLNDELRWLDTEQSRIVRL
jgi:hypothetical protein